LGTAENASSHRSHGGRCAGIPIRRFLNCFTGMPTRIARHLALRRRWPHAMRGSLMDKDSPGSKRLYALIGEGADGLPRYFVEKLERILEQQESDRTACIGSPKLRVVRADQYVPQE